MSLLQKINRLLRWSVWVILSAGVLSFTGSSSSTDTGQPDTNGIAWITLEQALEKNKLEKRKIFMDVYTDWCGWCRRMDAETFQKPHIAKYLNRYYYPVKFDGEYKNDIVFKGKSYKFVKNGMRGYHELVAEMTQGRLSYPTIIFLDENLNLLQAIPGYREAYEFEQIITYFGRDAYKEMPWDTYVRNYKPLSTLD